MISFYFVKKMYEFMVITIVILVFVIIFYWNYNTEYLFDIYSLNDLVKEYEHKEKPIPDKEISRWRNIYKHPLVLPVIIHGSSSKI